ncbi:MAG TPA: glycosyltransferase [bacterium]|nr:glycosyltransferase [bacterium]
MRMVMVTLGSRGDVEPFVALGLGLKAAGHEVSVATGTDCEAWVRGLGLGFKAVGGDMRAAITSAEGRRLLRTRNPVSFVRRLRRTAAPILKTMQEDILAALAGADACVFSYLCGPVIDIHEARGLPCFMGIMQPLIRTGDFPNPAVSLGSLGRTLNRLTFDVFNLLMYAFFADIGNTWRRERFGLPRAQALRRLEKIGLPILGAFSPSIIPKPSDWPDYAHVTGYWFMPPDQGWTAGPELTAFLADGPAPVCVGFGSMVDDDPKGLTKIVEDALDRAGQRGIIVGGWGGVGAGVGGRHLTIESAPYDWLLPRTAAMVHHGGAGTTSAALRAGVPAVVVPFMGVDQPYFGRLVLSAGAGPRPIPRSKLTAANLAAAVTAAVSDENMRSRAAALGRAIREEDGVKTAVGLITTLLNH